MTRVGLIWAEARGGVIGARGGMPWHVPEDMAHFKDVTTGHPVIMGRRTWESFPPHFRPLPHRRNIVVTSADSWASDGAERTASLDEALALVADDESAWVIGGGRLYESAIGRADVLEVTELDIEVAGDTHAPRRDGWEPVEATEWALSRTGVTYRFLTLVRP
ncbi:dihydrofolate reductase [Microbacterium sp.]|uniref:dihydrofolate reductase n=1 Tax=Microbacterium sp. TaxID=51671 RepID=UPI0025EDA326|nr:dihydrofolate reductase [Microbacterium sp.]